jgi:dihydroorotate dehydrogenase (NAD+) catalytic subunit
MSGAKSNSTLAPKPDLGVSLGPLTFKNPIMPGSGCFNCGMEFEHAYDLSRLGAIINKTIMPRYRKGNPAERVAEVSRGMLNAIGTPTKGHEEFLAVQLPFMRSIGTSVIASLGGIEEDDFVFLVSLMDDQEGISGLELDLSCPNHAEKAPFALSAKATESLLRRCRRETALPIIAKLSPAVTDIVQIADAAMNSGADALCIANTYPALVIDAERRRPIIGNVTGGLSGPAIKPITLRLVWQVVDQLGAPVVASGGVETATDAIEYLLVGASVVQVGTANFYDPMVMPRIIDGIEQYLREQNENRLSDIIGGAFERRSKGEVDAIHHGTA